MIEDRMYSMSSFLEYRTVVDREKSFGIERNIHGIEWDRKPIYTTKDLSNILKNEIKERSKYGRIAIALSGGIDSAILAKYVPKGSIAYTFKCVVPDKEVVDESATAAKYAAECGLEHKIVEIYKEDLDKLAPILMRHRGEPIHSIEIQIYKAAVQAKADGCNMFVFGETADCIFGGHSNLLSRDWRIGDFTERWSFVLPYKVLKEPILIMEPYKRFEKDGYIDVPAFLSDFEADISLSFYTNACDVAGIGICAPYSITKMGNPLDLSRVRSGENKYVIRDLFKELYPGFSIPPKTPMPRPMNEWMESWKGPVRPEFWSHCIDEMTGDQKWLVYSLEKFLNILDEIE